MYFCVMKKNIVIVGLLITLFSLDVMGQDKGKSTIEDKISDQGVDFYISGGVFFGNKYTAAYYNGAPFNENNLSYIFDNYSWKQSIDNLITRNNHFISSSDPKIKLDEYPTNVKYTPAFCIQLAAKYRFNKHWGISLSYSFAKLKAQDIFTVSYNKVTTGNDIPDYLFYDIVAEENRSFFDLSAIYLFETKSIVKPFIEIGAQFNFVRVKSFDAIIEGQDFSLLDIYGGSTYVANSNMQTFNTKYGGPGFGFSGAFGLKLAFNQYVSLDPAFYVAVTRLGLKGYSDFAFNYGLMVRIVMNDSFFSK